MNRCRTHIFLSSELSKRTTVRPIFRGSRIFMSCSGKAKIDHKGAPNGFYSKFSRKIYQNHQIFFSRKYIIKSAQKPGFIKNVPKLAIFALPLQDMKILLPLKVAPTVEALSSTQWIIQPYISKVTRCFVERHRNLFWRIAAKTNIRPLKIKYFVCK